MADKRDYYEVLGLEKSASEADIKKAYRRLAKESHPDLHPGDAQAEARFKEAGEAYAVLSDAEKRAKYDQYGHAAFDPSMGGAGFGDMDFGDIFGDLFGGIFGGGRARRPDAPQQGQSIKTSVVISFEESAFGCERELMVPRVENCETCHGSGAAPGTSVETCKKCGGSGQIRQQQRSPFGMISTTGVCPDCGGRGKIIKTPCPTCRGGGQVKRQRKVTANIPAGIDNGQTIRLSGLGNSGKNGGPPGDLLVIVGVREHQFFRREGSNVLYNAPISFTQAALGAELETPTLEGKVKLTVPEGTQTGTVFRLRGKGFPSLRGGRPGDELVTVNIQTPKNLSEEQNDLLRRFADASGEKPPERDKKKKKK
ncbi:MAG: molecular chaperone DnaJ [Oscillospiraceae bacterium]|jgi:molecular chaperone DnaJ|nr:molecular chaperone DnaJ [Oscillospiraceae bacterium]